MNEEELIGLNGPTRGLLWSFVLTTIVVIAFLMIC